MGKVKFISLLENKHLDRICNIAKILAFILTIGISTLYSGIEENGLAASGGRLNVKVNYKSESIIIEDNNYNNRYYLSMDNMKSWEGLDDLQTIDISTLLKVKDTTIYLKGDKDSNPTPVILQGEDKSLKVLYKIYNEKGKIFVTGDSSREVEYRVGGNGSWNNFSSSFETAPYEIKGATLHFRTKAIETKRAGKIVNLKIPKRPTAPSVKVDGSKLCITGLKSGLTQYRTVDGNWRTFESSDSKIKTVDLRALLGVTSGGSIPAGSIEVRNAATDKKVASAIKTLEVTAQPLVPNTITLNGTTLTIDDSDKKHRYEYTIVERGAGFDLLTAKWKSVTTNKPYIIKNVEVYDEIYVRLKSSTVSSTKQVVPASTYKVFEVKSISF